MRSCVAKTCLRFSRRQGSTNRRKDKRSLNKASEKHPIVVMFIEDTSQSAVCDEAVNRDPEISAMF